MSRIRSSAARGFTLLEVLVSTVLLGTVFVAVMGLTAQSLRNINRMEPHEKALWHAREKMNQVLLLEELGPTEQAGRWDDGYQWHVQVWRNDRDTQMNDATYGLFHIRVVIVWAEQAKPKTYAIETTQWARKVIPNANQ
jgi:type II secretion system protein I